MRSIGGYLKLALLTSAATLAACAAAPAPAPATAPASAKTSWVYPAPQRGDVVDVYHGVSVPDPYRGFEDPAAESTKAWVGAQNQLAAPFLEGLAQRSWIKERLTRLWSYERFGLPREEGDKYFYLRNDGTQNQSVLYVADSLTAPARVLLDPNAKSADATIALSQWEPSPDGSILAYALSDGGTDWNTWHFRQVADGSELPTVLRFSKFWGVSWARDGSGVYYSRYPEKDGRGDDAGRPDVYFHKLNTPQSDDRLVFKVEDHPTRVPAAEITRDGRYLIIGQFDGYDKNGVWIQDLRDPKAKAKPLLNEWDALYSFIGSDGDDLYFLTTNQAPLRRVIAVNAKNPAPARWREVVPQADIALSDASYVGGRIIANYVRDACSVVRLYEKSGRLVGDVSLPGLGSAGGFAGNGTSSETFYSYTDFLTPAKVMRFDAARNESAEFKAPDVQADFSPYVTEQVFYSSKDGTRIPMFVTRRKDAPRDGSQAVLLYGYGGFDVSLTPTFSPAILTWLEMGGTYALANLRGGGEYGQQWHLAGTKLKKQNVFDDFIAAAEYLVREKYTQPSRLAVYGRSNGGLLVGAVLTQRPGLFGAALPAVGVLDMLRYHTASANARQWSSDYGLAENPDEFKALKAYSPVHNVRDGVCYPPTLVTTADRDDRVVPWHSYKFAAELQRVQTCTNPVLIRVETRAGHGAGKPIWMQIEDFADQFGFVANALKLPAPVAPAAAGR
jgi:prolyl oligopeptidase